ncbi:hypothetical protein BDR03DRAFT_935253 [Suillus americanus]|nr:hypothetical protein BDR03DRAFT_935253 [Suillus americanus]
MKKVSQQPLVSLGPHHQWSGDGHIWAIQDQWSGKWLGMWVNCESEMTEVYNFTSALSVHNITIKYGWLCVWVQWGDNVKVFWEASKEIYNDMDLCQYDLVQWLWLKLIQQELDKLKHCLNTHTVHYDHNKHLPLGVLPNVAMLLHKDYNAKNCLQSVDHGIVKNLMEEIGGEDLIHFVDSKYSANG